MRMGNALTLIDGLAVIGGGVSKRLSVVSASTRRRVEQQLQPGRKEITSAGSLPSRSISKTRRNWTNSSRARPRKITVPGSTRKNQIRSAPAPRRGPCRASAPAKPWPYGAYAFALAQTGRQSERRHFLIVHYNSTRHFGSASRNAGCFFCQNRAAKTIAAALVVPAGIALFNVPNDFFDSHLAVIGN